MGRLGDIGELLRNMKRRPPSKIYCPRCGSPDIHLSNSTDYFLTPKKYICNKCGYHGMLIMELEKEEG